MPPLTRSILSSLEQAINQVPEQLNAFRSQSDNEKNQRAKERKLFRKLLVKLAGIEKDDQLAFLVEVSRKINKKSYVQVTLDSIPTPPDYSSTEKNIIFRRMLAKLTGNEKVDQGARIRGGEDTILLKLDFLPKVGVHFCWTKI